MCVYARELLSFILYVAWVKIRIKEMEITKFGNNGLVCLPLRENLFVSALSAAQHHTHAMENFSCLFYVCVYM